jgi:signal transduction histidine kinase/transcriptional regulator with PAS, ATPase and Fis domain
MTPRGDIAFATLEALPHTLTVIDRTGRLAYANPALWRALSLPPDACPPGSIVQDFVRLLACRGVYGPGDPEALVVEILALDRSQPFRRRVRGIDGRITEITSTPLPGGGYVACGVDVTDIATAEQDRMAQLRLYEAALKRLTAGVAVYDQDLRLSLANPAYAGLLGVPGAIRPGMSHTDILHVLAGRGEFGVVTETVEEAAAAMSQDRFRPATRIRERPNGQVLRFDSQPTAEGGRQVEVTDITALRRTQDEASRRATVLDGVLATLPHGVVVYGPDRRVAMINAAYRRIMAGAELAVGEHIDDVAKRRLAQGEFSEAHLRDSLREKFSSAADGSRALVRTRPNGTVISVRAARLPNGGHISVVTDITGQTRAEAEARSRASVLEASFAAMRHGLNLYGPDRRLIATNAKAGALTAYPADLPKPGMTLEEVIGAQARRGVITADQAAEALAIDRSKPNRYLRHRSDGSVMEVMSDPTADGGFVVTVSDVTAEHQAEAEARARAVTLDAVLEALPVGVVVYGPDERAKMMNAAYRQIMGDAAAQIGEALDTVTARRETLGEFGGDMAARIYQRRRGPREAMREPLRRQRPNGMVIDSHSGMLPDGGRVVVMADVTALHRAERDLEERAATQAAMLASIRQGIILYDAGKRVVAFNDRAIAMTGLDAQLLRPGAAQADLVAEQVRRGELSAEAEVGIMSLDRSKSYARTRQRPDGTTIEIVSDPTPNGGFVVTYADVTALRRAEQEARERTGLLEASLGAMRHGFALFGPDRRLILSNNKTAELTGFPEPVLPTGISIDEMMDRQLAAGEIGPERAAQTRALDRSQPHRYRRRRTDGTVIEIMSDPTPGGGFVVTYADVTALANAEAERAERAAMQEAMLGNLRAGVMLYGPDRRLRAANAAAGRLSLAPEQLTPGQIYDDWLAAQVVTGQITAEAAEASRTRDRTRLDRYLVRETGGRMLDVTSTPMPDGGFCLTVDDITEDRRIRTELDAARQQAEAASRAKSRFLATMTHELRTPLSAVIGFAEAIGGTRDAARIADYAGAIRDAGRHLLLLIDDILDVARSQTGALELATQAFPLGPVLAGAARAVQAQVAEAGLTLRLQVAPALPDLIGDAARLHQVMLNLLTNAVKFTPHGGVVSLFAEQDDRGVAIRVVDTGIGIAEEHRDRVFEPFSQVDSALARRFQGSGLGLHLARSLTEAMGGTLALEAHDGPGTRVLLRFPTSCLAANAAALPVSEGTAP